METNVVYNCDCIEWMNTLPDKYFDLCIVDPNYGINSNKRKIKAGRMKRDGTTRLSVSLQNDLFDFKTWDKNIPSRDYFIKLYKISRHQIIWGCNYFMEYLKNTNSIIVWYKENPCPLFSDGEMAWASLGGFRIFKYRWHGFFKENMNKNCRERKIHPTQKPVALYEWILKNYAKPGWKIGDTHVGSGSIRHACFNLGFPFEGSEIDKDYWELQEKWFKDRLSKGRLLI